MKTEQFQALETGDRIERNYAVWIRTTLPLYETIWSRYIGNAGGARPLSISGLSTTLERDREKFYQAHYSAMVAIIQLQGICDDYQSSLGVVSSASDYVRLQRDITTFVCFVGRVHDMMEKMDSALHLNGEVSKRFADFFRQRSNYLHGPIPSQKMDDDGLVSIALPGGIYASDFNWLDESRWSDSEHKRFVEVADYMRDSFRSLVAEVNAASSRLLSRLKELMPGCVSLKVANEPEDQIISNERASLSGTLNSSPQPPRISGVR